MQYAVNITQKYHCLQIANGILPPPMMLLIYVGAPASCWYNGGRI